VGCGLKSIVSSGLTIYRELLSYNKIGV